MMRVYWKRARVAVGLAVVLANWTDAEAAARRERSYERPRYEREQPRPQCGQRYNANDCSATRGCDWVRVNSSGAHRCARVTHN
jgi:hypothetical protein